MANEKIFQSRIQLKHDIEENWSKATNFIPKVGEIIIYDTDENNLIARFKIGDGVTNVNLLPFVSHHEVISYLPQELTEEQKTQARENIDAVSSETIELITNSIEELSADVAYINKEDNENIENPDVELIGMAIDSVLLETSVNPVQNKVITQELNKVSTAIAEKLDVPVSAQVGQMFRISAVDENGKVTAIEAIDAYTEETWQFELVNGTVIEKKVLVP